jgi:hypothetical protein
MVSASHWHILFTLALAFWNTCHAVELTDRWSRSLNGQTVTLLDWEGQIANPSARLFLRAPATGNFPISVDLTANHGRLYFDLPSTVSSNGPSKRITLFQPNQTQSFRIAIFPDRDFVSETHQLSIRSTDANGTIEQLQVPISVIDQDQDRPTEFNIIVNPSVDETTFFDDEHKLNIARTAAGDWAYFFGNMNLDEVAVNTETIFVWARDGSNSGTRYKNTAPYRGFLLYIYGVESPNLISGGQGSWEGGLQSSNGVQLELRRSGTYQANILGNYNRLTWFLTQSDHDWLHTANLAHQTNDLYSIAHHEIGHSIFYDASHPSLARFKSNGGITSSNLLKYFGRAVPIDSPNHLTGQIDPASGVGAFGNEYHGDMPRYRWLITKLDLFCAQAGGYLLRETTPIQSLQILPELPLQTDVGRPTKLTLRSSGGIPGLYWTVVEPNLLPEGLQLNSFTGEISGTPAKSGTSNIPVRLQDNSDQPTAVTNTFQIIVSEASPHLEIQSKPAEEKITLKMLASPQQLFTLQTSSNLINWTDLLTNLPLPFETNLSLNNSSLFFRAAHITD